MFNRAGVKLIILSLYTSVEGIMWMAVNKLVIGDQRHFYVDKNPVSTKLSTHFPQEFEMLKSIRFGSLEMRKMSYAHIHYPY